ncbi:MAG: terpene cyclase/mutase family protein [Ruminococcus sp.]|nr:terpene cyclase/mutase family protein [Ruminococcus sp.]
MLKRPAALLTAAVMMSTPICASALDTKQAEGYARGIVTYEKQKNGIPEGESLLSGRIAEDAGFDSSDWLAIAAVRSGLETDTGEYYSAWKNRIDSEYSDDGALDRLNATDWHRAVLTGICLGVDPTDVSEVDLLGRGTYLRGEGRPLDAQGLNGEIWALIAMDSCDWKLPEDAKPDRAEIISSIIDTRNSDGGFSLTAGDGRSDIDITAMALQALAPYRCCNETEDTVSGALKYLAESLESADNCESTAQIICALCCLDIDPDEDSRFAGLTDELISYANDDGGFAHLKGGESSELASSQALIALCSIQRLRAGERAVYDMNDGSPEKPVKTSLKEMTAAKNRNTSPPTLSNSPEGYPKGGKMQTVVPAAIISFFVVAVIGGIIMRKRKEKEK